jgi:AcrR family transcriptional regulator
LKSPLRASSRRLAATDALPLPGAVPSDARRVILDSALRLFAERGYAGASMRDIAAISSIQAPSLYSHYPSKQHLLAELARLGHEEHLRRIRAGLLSCQPDPREQVAAYVRAHVNFHTEFPMLAVVANSELHTLSPEIGAATFQLRGHAEQILMDVVQRGIDQRLFDVAQPWLAVAAIGGMGLRVAFWYSEAAGFKRQVVADNYAEFALRLLGARDGAKKKSGKGRKGT